MRQISIGRYKAKVRGLKRRLKAMDRWVDSFEGYEPPHEGHLYYNHKISVLDRLVEPPITTYRLQRHAINALLKVAMHLRQSPLRQRIPYYQVAVLVTWPYMFGSEVTVFYDPDYYSRFWNLVENQSELNSLSRRFRLELPEGFEESGVEVTYADDEDFPPVTIERWTLGEPI